MGGRGTQVNEALRSTSELPSALRDSADRLLDAYARSTGSLDPPVDVTLLARIMEAKIVDGDHDVLGLTVSDGNHYTISLGRGSRLSAGGKLTHRARFTVAHEIGHLLMASPEDRETRVFRLPGDAIETRCDQIAETLLMPVSVVHREFVFRRHGEVRVRILAEMAKRFDVSPQAFARRLASLGLLGDRWIAGWKYRRGETSEAGLRLAWAVADSSQRIVVEQTRAVNGGCAIQTFRTGIPHFGTEILSVAGRKVLCEAEAEPTGQIGAVEVLLKHANFEPGKAVQLTAWPVEDD